MSEMAGKMINDARSRMEAAIGESSAKIKEMEKAYRLKREAIDVTMPAHFRGSGSRHPVNMTVKAMCGVFASMGFQISCECEVLLDGIKKPELDTDLPETPLRTVCPVRYISPAAEGHEKPVICHRIEGKVTGNGISVSDLNGTMRSFVAGLFGEDAKTFIRPLSLPHTEPSVALDLACRACSGHGCSVCGGEGRIEVIEAGMVQSGFVFSADVERIAMELYGIDDVSVIYENDLRFLRQFK